MSKAMKRYAVFAWMWYESGGGWNDFREAFNTLEEASQLCDDIQNDPNDFEKCFHVVDLHENKIVYGLNHNDD